MFQELYNRSLQSKTLGCPLAGCEWKYKQYYDNVLIHLRRDTTSDKALKRDLKCLRALLKRQNLQVLSFAMQATAELEPHNEISLLYPIRLRQT